MVYNIQKNSKNLTELNVWYEKESNDNYKLKYNYSIFFENAFRAARLYGDNAFDFAHELQELRDKFYNFMSGSIERDIFPGTFSEKDLRPMSKWDMTYQKIMDYFLPLQDKFCRKWDLLINVD